MGHWNHRVVLENNTLSIREVFYNDAGQPCAVTQEPLKAEGVDYDVEGPSEHISVPNALADLRVTVERMAKALDKPVLDAATLEFSDF